MKTWIKVVWIYIVSFLYRTFGRRHLCGCGHTAKQKTLMIIDDQKGIYDAGPKREYCPECWAKAVIKCAWCGKAILPGDPLTLNTPQDKDFKIPEYAVVYQRTPHLRLVGCLRWDCAETGMDRAGFWIMPGKVQRVLSPLQKLLFGMTGEHGVLIVNDLGDPREAVPILHQTEKADT